MKLADAAKLIPAEYRKEILDTNMISTAASNRGNVEMQYLATVWKTNIEPDFKETCGICLTDLLRKLVAIQPYLIELEKESRLLDSL